MEEINLESIKRENISRIFAILSRGGLFSRSELAAETGLSLMTVGKTVGLLEEHNALLQTKRQSEKVGRKSSVCRLNDSCAIMIFDLSSNPYSLHLVDILLHTCGKYTYDFNNLKNIAAEAFVNITSGGGVIIGTGCIIPYKQGQDDKTASPLYRRFTEAYGGKPDVVANSMQASAIADTSRFTTGTGVYLKFSASETGNFGAVIANGKPYRGRNGRAGNLGGLMRIYNDPVKAVAAICLTIDPEFIRIECDESAACENLREELSFRLSEYIGYNCPEIIVETPETGLGAVYGTALILRCEWLEKIV